MTETDEIESITMENLDTMTVDMSPEDKEALYKRLIERLEGLLSS
jgi:alpha-ketoglutarate-dependent taurine dioxygenase